MSGFVTVFNTKIIANYIELEINSYSPKFFINSRTRENELKGILEYLHCNLTGTTVNVLISVPDSNASYQRILWYEKEKFQTRPS